MARPLRLLIPDGWYHITARGNERRAVFLDDKDRQHFLELLAEMVDRYGMGLHAYVLMDNHYHLLASTPQANLSAALQWLGVSYSSWFNRRRQRSGHLFQGRFKAIVLEPESASLEVSRYVHLNPVRVEPMALDKSSQQQWKAGARPPVNAEVARQRITALRRYRWTSYHAYGGWVEPPGWLKCQPILERLGVQPSRRFLLYRSYVEEVIREGHDESPWERLEAGILLGGSEFVQRLRELARGDAREQPALGRLAQTPPWESVVAAVEKVKREKWAAFCHRHGDWGRDMALYLGQRRCGKKLNELGVAAGGMDYVAVCMAIRRFEGRLEKDPDLARAMKAAAEALGVAAPD